MSAEPSAHTVCVVIFSEKKRKKMEKRMMEMRSEKVDVLFLEPQESFEEKIENVLNEKVGRSANVVLLHKLTDWVSSSNIQLANFLDEIRKIEENCLKDGDSRKMTSVCPLSVQRVVSDRYSLFLFLQKVLSTSGGGEGDCHLSPLHTFLYDVQGGEEEEQRGRILLKTRLACGPPFTHMMRIVNSAEEARAFSKQLKEEIQHEPVPCSSVQKTLLPGIEPGTFQESEYPVEQVVGQPFVAHGGVLFKCFVVGDCVDVFTRPSLPDHFGGEGGRAFDSQKMAALVEANGAEVDQKILEKVKKSLKTMNTRLKAHSLDFGLYGVDIIRCAKSSELFVVDLNYFPTFKEVDDLPSKMRRMIENRLV